MNFIYILIQLKENVIILEESKVDKSENINYRYLILYVIPILKPDFVGFLTMFFVSLPKVKAGRDSGVVARCLAALEDSARSGQGNLLELAVAAARARYPKPSHTPLPTLFHVNRY